MRTLIPSLAGLLLTASCGGGNFSPEPYTQAAPNVYGAGERLSQLNNPASGSVQQDTYTVSGVRVSWVDTFDETGDGKNAKNVFLQDFTAAPGPYEGIIAFGPTYSPPSLHIAIGDIVDATGTYSVFFGTPELAPTISFRFDSVNEPLVPMVIDPNDLLDPTKAGQWISMLVTIPGPIKVQLGKLPAMDAQGNYLPGKANLSMFSLAPGATFDNTPKIANQLYDMVPDVASLQYPLTLTSVTGILLTDFDTYDIAPRSLADIQFN